MCESFTTTISYKGIVFMA